MEVHQISKLASIIRENGEQILNASCKFSLSSHLLDSLNSSFGLLIDQRDTVNTSFHIINTSNVKTEIYRDLQFLHDFIQRTVSLKLTPASLTRDAEHEVIDINKFKNLKLLELYKIKTNSVVGIQSLRTQLQFLTCTHSLENLCDVLEKCGGDESEGFIWCELKAAIFAHNNLESLDTSLNQVPWLHTLDLSHNCLKNAEGINCLSNLKYLNLSYNRLEVVPIFSGQLCNRLQVLILHNNFIEDVRELNVLVNLCELDLAVNCLVEHDALGSVAYLAALQWLNLVGNPLSFHPQHRIRTARFLHANTASVRFMLDKGLLNKNERKLVGLLRSIPQRNFTSTLTESTNAAPERLRRVRNATITESNPENSPDFECSCSSLLLSNDHLETKQKVEQIRREYGEAWLQTHGGGSLLQDALGLDKNIYQISTSPYDRDFLLHADITEVTKKPSEVTSDNVTYITASESDSFYAGEGDATEIATDDEPDADLGESDDNVYLATILNDADPVFVLLTNSHIWERDEGGKEKARWPLETLLSCELLGDDCSRVRLEFDTVRRDRCERTYVLEVDDATKLSAVLKNILDIRPPQSKLVVYRCMKCSAQFSNEKKRGRKILTLECPACFSTVVIEDDGN